MLLTINLVTPGSGQDQGKKAQRQDPEFSEAQLEHFEKRIRPLLAKRCFKCHGPDAKEAEGGLRMTSRGALLIGGDTGPALVPGDPAKSLLIDSINYGEVYEMPPDSKMPAEEIKLLTDWVRDQAPWPASNDSADSTSKAGLDLAARIKQHWSWHPVKPAQPPEVKNTAWPLDGIDRFILAKNEQLGLSMAEPADRRVWIRRVFFDLIGLPPTPQQVQAFLADNSPDAFEKVVDQLLQSEHFGEKWARHWMDLVRYAETCGHEFEYPIPHANRYRSYLIRAFNQDVPYDLFVKEHIAGDLLPNPRLNPRDRFNESIIGTGFWFLHEATHAPVDVRLDEANHNDNRIDVKSKTFLGLTVACARCHDHKFDAITTRDYYGMIGYMQSSRRQLAMLDPRGEIHTRAERIRQVCQKVSQAIRKAMEKDLGSVDSIRHALLSASGSPAKPENVVASRPSGIDSVRKSDSTGIDVSKLDAWKKELADAEENVDHPLWVWRQVTGKDAVFDRGKLKELVGMARRSEAMRNSKSLPRIFADFDEPGFRNWFLTGEAFTPQPTSFGHWDSTSGKVQYLGAGYADSGQLSKRLHGVLRSPTFEIRSNEIWYRIKGENVKLRVIIDGYVMDVYNGLLFGGVSINVNTKDKFQWVRHAGDLRRYKGHRAHLEIIDQGGGYAIVDQVVFTDGGQPPYLSATARRIVDQVADSTTLEEFSRNYSRALSELERHGLIHVTAGDDLENLVDQARKEIEQIERTIPNPILVPAITDGTPEDEHLFVRGNHKALGPTVPRHFLEALDGGKPIEGSDRGSGRLALARRIASPENPFTARVMVNRLWHHLFGRGIVASTDNFGVLGKRPSHPALLDYLASEFIKNGWSVKKMLRRMVLSRTYRMSSRINPAAEDVDPQNVYLHRMSVRRLPAEAIRDSILAVSGRLDLKIGGPSVPIHLTPFMQGRGRPGRSGPIDGNGRRSLYIEIRRNFLPPMLIAFDMPIPFNTVGRRNQSNVPAQALILMNDPFVVGQAEVWAKRLIADKPDPRERIRYLYEQAFARPPSKQEAADAEAFLREQAAALRIKPEAMPASVPLWKDLCHVIFNVKEFTYLK